MVALTGYWWFAGMVRTALFCVGAAAALVALVDWAARTRRLNPFGPVARFCRNTIDPLMGPVERIVIRAGGRPSMTPWWSWIALIVAAMVAVTLLDSIGGIVGQIAAAMASPGLIPMLALSWAIAVLRLALIVRVISSWTAISPSSGWVRWSYLLTEWMLAPLRRIIPLVGAIDITPLAAWLLLSLIQRVFGIP